MTCRDAIEVLSDFLEQTLAADVQEALEEHLRSCAPCRAYLRTYDRTRTLVGKAGRAEMPAELKARLRSFLLAELSRPAGRPRRRRSGPRASGRRRGASPPT
jgi:anti-sigma factor RsiW